MPADAAATRRPEPLHEALGALASSASRNIPGVDLASITLHAEGNGCPLRTIASTDNMADRLDELQYGLGEGPCVAAVTDTHMILVSDLAHSADFPTYGPEAARRGARSQAAVQVVNDGRLAAGLNLYARRPGVFSSTTMLWAQLFTTQLATLLDYARQVGHLNEALDSRTDIGTAIGILMERYSIDRSQGLAFLVRTSSHRNTKIRALAQQLIEGTFQHATDDGPG